MYNILPNIFSKILYKKILLTKYIRLFRYMNLNPKYFLSLLVFCLYFIVSQAQNTPYLDPIYNEITTSTENYSDVYTDAFHTMDIYQPKVDTNAKRPLIIYIHGGAFYAGDKATPDCVDFCTNFAQKGYVAVSVNYRLANPLLFLANRSIQLDAVLKTMADVKSAIRYFTKDAATSNLYKIDSTAVFVGGYSAGAVAALHTAWVTDTSELDQELISIMKSGIKTFEGDAGNDGYGHKIKGIFSLAGALFQTNYVNYGDVPAYLAHAKDDGTVSYECAPGLNDPRVVTLCGTGKIYPRLDSLNIYFDTMVLETGGHGWPGLGNNSSDFKNAVDEIATFFYPLLLDNVRLNASQAQKSPIQLYPNPSNGSCTFQLPSDQKSVEIRIYNLHAQLQFATTITETTSLKLPLQSGLYKVVITGKHAQTETLVIE